MVKIGDKIRVVQEDLEHPFYWGEELKVTELLDYGCVWAKNNKNQYGCLIPEEFKVIREGE